MADAAVTFRTDRLRLHLDFRQPTGISVRELERVDPDLPHCVAVVGAGRLGTALAAALRAAASRCGPLGRGADGRGRRCRAPVRAGRRDRRGRGRDRRPARSSATARARRRSAPLARPRGLLAAPAHDRHRRRTPRFAGAGAAVAGSTPARPRRRRARWPARSACGRSRSPTTTAPPTTPPPRSPRTSSSRSRRPPSGSPPPPASDRDAARPARARHGRELGRSSAPERALTGPIARGDEATVARQRAAVAERAPELLPLFDALAEATRELARPGGAGMRTVRTVAELRAALAEPRRAGRAIGLVPTMGAFHEGHLSLIRRAREECDVVVVSLFVNPTQFDAGRGPRRLPARRGARRRAWPSAEGVDLLFAPGRRGGLPAGLRHHGRASGALTESLEGAHRGAAHFDGVATVVTKLFNMVGARRRLLRAEGRPAGARDPPPGARPRHPGRIEVVPDRARARRPRAVQPQRLPRRRASASALGARADAPSRCERPAAAALDGGWRAAAVRAHAARPSASLAPRRAGSLRDRRRRRRAVAAAIDGRAR